MTETQMLTMAAALVAAMFGLLCGLIGWIGSRAINKLEELAKIIGMVKDELHNRITEHEDRNARDFAEQERRVSNQFVAHDRRITKIEATCEIHHNQD